ncbi:MAG: hypothetical protein QGI45_03430 [Myxococcota bacterium]|nr:hypothetical protein [Myxococcota bacterium]
MRKTPHSTYSRRQHWHYLAAGILLASALASGCNCKEKTTLNQQPEWACHEDDVINGRPALDTEACPNGGRFVKGACMESRCDAGDLAPNCCPGTYCTAGGVCELPLGLLKFCTEDSECDEGQYCLDRSKVSANFAETKVCGFVQVDAEGTCPEGLSPFNQRCLRTPPCGGTCAEGSVCNIDTNNCESAPTQTQADATCAQTCGDNQLLVFSDPDNMIFHGCCALSCECIDLPALQPGPFGRYSDLLLSNDKLLISGYDTFYGDLALGTYELDGTELSIEYVDGVPTSGTVLGSPDGPRNGITTPGPDIGSHTSMELSNNTPLIVYRDNDQASLKFAHKSASAEAWTIASIDAGVDDDSADLGYYTAMAIDSTGLAHVSYYAHRYTLDGSIRSGLKYARAKTSTPTSADDWEVAVVDSIQSCNVPCAADASCVLSGESSLCLDQSESCDTDCACGEVCVDDNGSPSCLKAQPQFLDTPCSDACTPSQVCVDNGEDAAGCLTLMESSCNPACSATQSCVDDGAGNNVCRTQAAEPSGGGLPYGAGLFSQIAILEDTPVFVYYDNIHHTLRAAYANFTSAAALSAGFTSQSIACHAEYGVGMHPNIAVNNSDFAITYQGLSGENLNLYQASGLNNLFAGTAQVIDAGVRTSQQLLVGAFSTPLYLDNQLYILYADQTNNNLVISQKPSETWEPSTIASQGALGSFINALGANNKIYTSTYKRYFNDTGIDLSSIAVFNYDPANTNTP